MSELATILQRYEATQIFVVQDACVDAQAVLGALPYPTLRIAGDEAHKGLETIEQIWTFLNDHQATRHALLINIGGGSVTDMGGFAAATYVRGIDYINIPTTLLAMVDASIGGKTGVNFAGLKNRVGAFHQPIDTIIEPAFLTTLPNEQWLSGYGEILKTQLLSGQPLTPPDREMDIAPLIRASVQYKKGIVEQDPTENGLRQVLNFGHTVGHALEEQAQGAIPHGYAVVWGMIAELYLSVVQLDCPREPLTQLTSIMIAHYGKPQCHCKEMGALIEKMRSDKKNVTPEGITFTLLTKTGSPQIGQVVNERTILEALDYLFSL